MPSINQNLDSWNKDWGHDGSEWSQAWGSDQAMWQGSILPRIGRHLPAESILEIAPGRGRVTQFLLPACKSYLGIDLSPTCAEACQQRFPDQAHARFATTGGTELHAAQDASATFAISWDSLVHADMTVLRSYLGELARVLKPGAFAFLHHANLAEYADPTTGKLSVENIHWRDHTVSAELVRKAAAEVGLRVRVQELVQWGVAFYSDCFTLLELPGEELAAQVEPKLLRHPGWNEEMALTRTLSESYWQI